MQTKKLSNSINYGDQFALGEHRIICGSSLDTDLVNKFLNGEVINQINCDPPYAIAATESKAGFKQKLSCPKNIIGDHLQSDREYKEFNMKWIKNVKSFLASKNSIYIFNSDRMIFSLREAMIASGLKFSQMLIWVKSQPVIGRLDYLPQFELIAYGWLGTHPFRRSQDRNVLFYPKPNKSKYHPTTKPIGLIRNLIINNTNVNDTIFDCFLGSGTCLLACEQTKRKCLGIELDPDYIATVISRWEALTNKTAKKLN